MKLTVHLMLIALVLAVPFVMRRPAAPSGPGAQRRLVVVTPHNQDIRREFERAFCAWYLERFHQSVTIDYRSVGGTADIKRLLATTYNSLRVNGTLPPGAASGIDVVWGGGDFFFDHDLKPMGILVPLKMDSGLLNDAFPQPTLAGVRLYDGSRDSRGEPAPQWVGVCLSSFGIVYNPDLYRPGALDLDPPRRWSDLADEKLAGYVALADPTHSGSAAVAYLMVIQRAMADAEDEVFSHRPELAKMPATRRAADAGYNQAIAAGWKRGMGQLLLIAANARYFTDSAVTPPADVANGQAAAGMAIDFYGRVNEETVGPGRCRFVLPEAATATTPDPVAVLRGGDEELANRFVEFLLTPRGQRIWDLKVGVPGGPLERALRRAPIRRDVYADRAGWADDVDPFREAGDFNQRAAWTDLLGDLQPIWAAAWIDSRDDLESAYRRILAVADAAARRRLLARLADLPIEMADVRTLKASRQAKEMAHDPDLELWKARQRIEWAARFRRHYLETAAGL